MNSMKLMHGNKKYCNSVQESIEENFNTNVFSEKLNDECEKNHIIPCLCTQDGIKVLNFLAKVDDKTYGYALSCISSNMLYSLLMKR